MDEQFLARVRALAAAGRRSDLDYGAIVARVLADQFNAIAAPTANATAAFESSMLEALSTVDDAGAARIATLLAGNPATPAAVLHRLTEIGPQTATIVMRKVGQAPIALLCERAEKGSPAEALVIAERRDIDSRVAAALARRIEPEVLTALATNEAAGFDRASALVLTQRGRTDMALGRALLARGLASARALQLFLAADRDMRRLMMIEAQRLTMAAAPTRSPLADLRAPAVEAARAGDHREFAGLIARRSRTSRADVDRLIDDRRLEPLSLLISALEIGPDDGLDLVLSLRGGASAALIADARLALGTNAAAAYRIVSAVLGLRAEPAAREARRPKAPPPTQAASPAEIATPLRTINRV